MRSPSRRSGFTLIELLVVISIVGVLIAMLLPAVQRARESSRRAQCKGNMKQLGIAIHNYHQTFQMFPSRQIGPSQADRLNGYIGLLPHFDQAAMYQKIQWDRVPQPWTYDATNHPVESKFWNTVLPLLQCPSNVSSAPLDSPGQQRGGTSYAFCVGDTINHRNDRQPRGVFGVQASINIRFVRDGTSSTIAMGEICRPLNNTGRELGNTAVNGGGSTPLSTTFGMGNPGACSQAWDGRSFLASATVLSGNDTQRGYRWADGAMLYTGFNTMLGPNRGSCLSGTSDADSGVFTASSYHEGGVNVLLCDGSVKFVNDSINAGNNTANENTGKSVYGVWGALGTREGDEPIGEFAAN